MRQEGRLGALHQAGSLKLLFPRTAESPQAVLVNTAGGITGGDRFSIDASVEPAARLSLTTQAAERAYRAHPGSHGSLTTRLRVAEGATLNWLPQETILFDGSALTRSLHVDLAAGASFTLVEPLIFGRTAMGEVVRDTRFQDEIAIRRDGRLAFVDRTRLAGDLAEHLARPAVANGAGAMAIVLHANPQAAAQLDPVRALLPETAGASLLHEDLLVIRALAADGFALRRVLIPVLTHLTQEDLPRPWML